MKENLGLRLTEKEKKVQDHKNYQKIYRVFFAKTASKKPYNLTSISISIPKDGGGIKLTERQKLPG
jgi:hypothetical protein